MGQKYSAASLRESREGGEAREGGRAGGGETDTQRAPGLRELEGGRGWVGGQRGGKGEGGETNTRELQALKQMGVNVSWVVYSFSFVYSVCTGSTHSRTCCSTHDSTQISTHCST